MQQSITADANGLGGGTATATITVNVPALHAPNVTNAATPENTQTSSGLVITPNESDTSVVTRFRIGSITGGTLFQHDGTTKITNGSFITLAQGAAGSKFKPTSNSVATGGFTVQQSVTGDAAGLGGDTVTAIVAVTSASENLAPALVLSA